MLTMVATNPGKASLQIAAFQEFVDDFGDDGAQETVARLVSLSNQRERLVMDYRRFDGHAGSYRVEPHHLAAYHGNWYMLAVKSPGSRMEIFALSRCRRIECTGEHFARQEGFKAEDFFRNAFGITVGEKPWRVRLVFAPEVATYIRERCWHPSQQVRERRDGSVELLLETSGRKELTRWILSWVPYVRVLSPHELRVRVGDRLRSGLLKFGGSRIRAAE